MKRYQGYQFKQAVEELTHKIAAEFGVNVDSIYWDNDVQTAGINNRGMVYFSDVTDDEMKLIDAKYDDRAKALQAHVWSLAESK